MNLAGSKIERRCHRSSRVRFFIRLFTVSSIAFLIFVIPQTGQPADRQVVSLMNQAKKYYWGKGADQDYQKALELYEQAAMRGDAEASFIAGGMYYTGKGTLKNPLKAFKYLDYAAAHGKTSPDAQRALGQFYLLGDVVPQNYEKAAKWYKDAAATGDPDSEIELGFLHYIGRGVAQDYKKAFELFQKAALQNNSMAQYNMGIMWYSGNGVEESNLEKAYAWFSIAATRKYQDAINARDYLETVLSREEIDRAQNEAAALYRKISSPAGTAEN